MRMRCTSHLSSACLAALFVVGCVVSGDGSDAALSTTPPPPIQERAPQTEPAEDTSEPGRPDTMTPEDTGSPPPPQDAIAPEDTAAPEETCTSYAAPEAVGTLPPSVTEASGLVVSQHNPGVLWVHNDSGDQSRIYALETSGERIATITLADTYAYDWEDMSGGPCSAETDTPCLYIGDIGDNNRVRQYLKIHRVPEPNIALGDQVLPLSEFDTMTVVYPDEPHDCEALVVDAKGHIYVLTKEWEGSRFRLYGSPYMPGTDLVPLQFLSEHDIETIGGTVPLVTAASFSIPTNRLLVRTYSGAFEYRLAEGASLSELRWAPVQTVPVANEGQGEAIAQDPLGYWHVSEGKEPPIWRVLCQ